jgi:DNA-binding response OmpR family regulator
MPIIVAVADARLAADLAASLRQHGANPCLLANPLIAHDSHRTDGVAGAILAQPATRLLPALVHLRQRTAGPILVLAPGAPEALQCALLAEGATLVLAQPASPTLICHHLRALLRLPPPRIPDPPTALTVAELQLDLRRQELQIAGQPPHALTDREARLLALLMDRPHRVVPAATIIAHLWGRRERGDRARLRKLVSRLRARIEPDPRQPRYLHTASRQGYGILLAAVPPLRRAGTHKPAIADTCHAIVTLIGDTAAGDVA